MECTITHFQWLRVCICGISGKQQRILMLPGLGDVGEHLCPKRYDRNLVSVCLIFSKVSIGFNLIFSRSRQNIFKYIYKYI